MIDGTRQGSEITGLVEAWMDTAKNFWKDIGAAQQDTSSEQGFSCNFDMSDDFDEDKYKTYQTWQHSINNFTSFLHLMSAPENRDSVMKGANAFGEAMVKATGESLENITEFQAQLVDSFSKVSQHTRAYNFDELDHKAFESFRELYRSELQKYLYVPKIGLPRESQEELSQLLDRSNIFYSHLLELLYLFYVPFEKTNRVLQKRMKEMLEKGEFYEDGKQAYNDWVRILEGQYMELLKSKEYTHVLNNTIGSLAEYKNVKNNVIGAFLKELQIPTNKDMDAVYKDLYQMKKKIQQLTRQVESLKDELNQKSN